MNTKANENINIELHASKPVYIGELINASNYLTTSEDEGYLDICFLARDNFDQKNGFMAGYLVMFYDYNDLISNAVHDNENMYDLAVFSAPFIQKNDKPQNIYMNLFINNGMSLEVEGFLYLHLKDMLFQLLHYLPDYIAGIIRQETFDSIREKLSEQGYQIVNKEGKYVKILWSKNL